jgi:hypothetical protein
MGRSAAPRQPATRIARMIFAPPRIARVCAASRDAQVTTASRRA